MPFFRHRRDKDSHYHKKTDNQSFDKDKAEKAKTKKRIAIIGSGVSGLTCAHYLKHTFDVTIFEANDYIGGHVNTIDVSIQDGKKRKKSNVETSAIDTGFIVFNERTYPNFFRLLADLNVPFQKTDMSFSVKNTVRRFEYNGHTLNTLLSQRKNALNPKFWRFINDILRFNKHIKQLRQDFDKARDKGESTAALTQQTLGGYLADQRYGKLFTDNYLLPMVSAIWSSSLDDVQDFPLVFFARFFDNHGLLDVVNRPQWFTIKGGSKQYVNKLVTRFVKDGGTTLVNTPVQKVTRADGQNDNHVSVVTNPSNDTQKGQQREAKVLHFDEVIFACHADTALKLLSDASAKEREVLSHFHFTKNTAVLHTDTSVLPKKPLAWASWNYLIDNKDPKSKPAKPVLTYHMNILQRLTKRHNYLVTLNHAIDDKQVIKTIDYSHPVYNNEMIKAQNDWAQISSNGLHTHFCGAYWFNGFHEDGVRSGLRVCQSLGVDVTILNEVDPSHLPNAADAHTPFRYKDLPVNADKKARTLNKRQIITASTNQALIEYVTRLQSKPNTIKTKKCGLFGRLSKVRSA